jgi:hypothetical protein
MYKKMVDCSPPVKRVAHPYFRVTRILGFKNVISDFLEFSGASLRTKGWETLL